MPTVGKILKNLNFSLKTNVKSIANGGKPRTKKENEDRNNQFEYINKMIIKFAKRRMPAIIVPVIWLDTQMPQKI